MADQVRGHDETAFEHRRQALERGGVVQPAVQGQHRHTVFRPPTTHGNLDSVKVQQMVLGTERRTHALSP
ncbi:hypothetical protein D3C76_1519440 [compost metagenome]